MKVQSNKVLLVIVLLAGVILHTSAQDKRLELNLRGLILTELGTTDDSGFITEKYTIMGISGELHWLATSNFSVGGFYSRSLFGDAYIDGDYRQGITGFYPLPESLSYGLSMQLTTNRMRFLRGYFVARTLYQELTYDFTEDLNFTLAESGFVIGAGGGIVVKLSRSVGINLIEVSYNKYLSGFEYTTTTFKPGAFQFQSGFVFRMLNKK